MSDCDIGIVGAGPYGLAAAAHLRAADSLRIAAFGDTMSFWAHQMPAGMLLRSPYVASSIGDADGELSLPGYERAQGLEPASPVPLTRFVDYGRWVQQRVLPQLDPTRVAEVARNGSGFNLRLENGDTLHATRVVVAAGIGDFAAYPEVLRDLPRTLVSHSVEHHDLGRFAGARVLVIGGGQSALESAALLAEAGAAVEVAVREGHVNWLTRRWHHKLGPISAFLYAWPDVGPAGVSRMVALPQLFRQMPRGWQIWMTRKALRPAGSGWLPPRLGAVTITTGIEATAAAELGEGARVTFSDGSMRDVDHVLLGTGYRIDIIRYPFLAPALVRQIKTANGYPVLRRGFESSVDGLHFMGAPAAWSYGPLMRFVAGTIFAGPELAKGVRARVRAAARR